MKRFISILMILSVFTFGVFAQDGDEYDDGYVYEQNGAGDQFLKFDLLAAFPLNFDGQLYVGAGASLGYYRFITSKIALGGSLIVDYNITIGHKPLITLPITFEVMYQPYIGKFEFPLMAGIGIGCSSCQGISYFPGLSAKISANAFYRFSESWSFGVTSTAFWLPQWFSDSSKNADGFFATAGLGIRYHF